MSRILLVDGDVEDRSVLKKSLEERGFSVIEAKDGQEALKLLLSSEPPSAVVLNLEVPRLSGVELLDLMSRYVRLSRIPVALITGGDQPIVPRYDRLIGSFAKPCDVDELVRALRGRLASERTT